MPDLLSWCLAIAAEIDGRPCPECRGGKDMPPSEDGGWRECLVCSGSGKAPPEVVEGEEPTGLCQICGKSKEDTGDEREDDHKFVSTTRTVYTSPYVIYAYHWLEERGDPRFVVLRRMKVVSVGPYGGTEAFMVLPDKMPGVYYKQADAIRELLKRALASCQSPSSS